jgi:hypothetical protein
VPFVLFYRLESDGTSAQLSAATGLAAGATAIPDCLDVQATRPWPLAAVIRSGQPRQVDDVERMLGSLPCGPYPDPPHTAFVVPLRLPGTGRPCALMIAGVSARLPLTEMYRGFYDFLASSITAAITVATRPTAFPLGYPCSHRVSER